MRTKPITRRQAKATKQPMWGMSHIRTVKCSECKKDFELLSVEWAYKVTVYHDTKYQCSWTCCRKAKERLLPPEVLRGGGCVNNM